MIVLLPQLAGSTDLFAPFHDDLARDHEVLTVTMEPTNAMPSTQALAEEVLRRLEVVPQGSTLFGISLGGMVAQWVALRSNCFSKVVLASTTAHGAAASLDQLGLARCLVVPGEASVKLVHEVVNTVDPEERARLTEAARAHPYGRYELIWLALAAALHDSREAIAKLQLPTLVLTGTSDTLIPPVAQAALAAAIQGARHTLMEGVGHDLTIDEPEVTAQLVREFIKSR